MPSQTRTRLVLAAIAAAAALAIGLVAVLLLGTANGGSVSTPSAEALTAEPGGGFAGGVLSPRRPAPALALRDATGARVDLAAGRGDAVFVTFLYTDCPDICPLTTVHLRRALDRMPAPVRAKVRIIAVSVDPVGDTPVAVRRFLARHRMTGRMSYLVGSAAELRPIWKSWGVASINDASSDFVTHSALVYGIDAGGGLTTVYPSDVPPEDLVHDAPRLIDAV
jgi:protein SCO1/2